MKTAQSKQPLIPAGWLRVLIFLICYIALIVGAGFLTVYWMPAPAETAAEGNPPALRYYLIVVINAVLSMLTVWLFRKLIDRRSFESLGFGLRGAGLHAAAGFFLGLLLLCTGSVILFFSHHLQWTGINFNGNDLFISFGLMLIVAFYEETVFRGYVLSNLLESCNKWLALLLSAIAFALVHMSNPSVSIPGIINILLAGILLGLNYIYTRSIWFSIALHFTWNFVQGALLGYSVSGMPLRSLLQHDVTGNEWITGGKFGFEGSLLATTVLLLAILSFLLLYEKKYRPLPPAASA